MTANPKLNRPDILAAIRTLLDLGDKAASADVTTMIERAEVALAEASTEATALAAVRTGLLVTADDQTLDAHDARQRKAEVQRDRLDASLEALAKQREAAEAREATEARAAQVAAAEAARDAVIAKFPEYRKHCEALAAFLDAWEEAERLCDAAGVQGLHSTYRWRARTKRPDREEVKEYWVDGYGRKACYWNGDSAKPADGVRLVRETVVVEGEWDSGQRMDNLLYAVKLPALTLEDDLAGYWPKG